MAQDDPDLVKQAQEHIDLVKDITGGPKKPKPPKLSRDDADAEADAGLGLIEEVTKPDPHKPGRVERIVAANPTATPDDLAEARGADQDLRGDTKDGPGCTSPLMLAGLGVAVIVAVILVLLTRGGDDKTASGDCESLGAGEVAAAPAQECTNPDATTDGNSDSSVDTIAPGATAPPGEPVRYAGNSGGPIGCITCDGQSRFINIAKSTTAKGNENMAAQEIVWPQDGKVTDFGVSIDGPNRGRYGINLFVNGEYSAGCALEIGMTSCQVAKQAPSVLKQGDRVTLIVGEGGTVDEDGVPTSQGEFTMDWYFVFEAD